MFSQCFTDQQKGRFFQPFGMGDGVGQSDHPAPGGRTNRDPSVSASRPEDRVQDIDLLLKGYIRTAGNDPSGALVVATPVVVVVPPPDSVGVVVVGSGRARTRVTATGRCRPSS